MVGTRGKRRRKAVGHIPWTGAEEFYTVVGQRSILVGFEVVLQFDGSACGYGGADRGRLDRPHAAADMDRRGTHRYGNIRYDDRGRGGRRYNNGWRYCRQRDPTQVAGCARISGGYPAEISLKERVLDIPPASVRVFADDHGSLPRIQDDEHRPAGSRAGTTVERLTVGRCQWNG